MKKIFVLLFTFISAHGFGQNIQAEINDQVWKPFIKSFIEHDAAGFLGVHSRDLIRSPRDSKILLNWNEYFKQQEEGDKRAKEQGSTNTIELRFTERIANATQAIEIGIYKGTFKDKSGEVHAYYGRFHVVLRKENSVWKILVDTDSSEGNSITEKDFFAAKPM